MILYFGMREGMREIWAHKFRSFLTMLGVILGVASLMAMFALTEGMARGFRATLQLVGGIERVEVTDMPVPPEQESLAELSQGKTMVDVVALRRLSPVLAAISPQVTLNNGKITFMNKASNPNITGVLQDFLEVDRHVVAHGRFITDLDLANGSRVCVLGAGVVGELFGDSAAVPLGEQVRINGELFRVVGIFERYMDEREKKALASGEAQMREERRKNRGSQSTRGNRDARGGRGGIFFGKNNTVAIPMTTMQKVFKSVRAETVESGPDAKLSRLHLKIRDPARLEEALQQARNTLMMTHRGIRDFGFDTREDWLDSIESATRAAKLSGGLIAGISLLVGGLGIANIMLASISERIREIGIRRAVGARGADIFMQIVIESTALATLGGLLGVAAGYALIYLLVLLAPSENNPVVVASAVLISLGFAVLVGVLAGLYPAWKAARLSPIQALRYE